MSTLLVGVIAITTLTLSYWPFLKWTWVSWLPPWFFFSTYSGLCYRAELFICCLTPSHRVFLGCTVRITPFASIVVRCMIYSVSSWHSTCPNRLPFLFTRLTGSNPNCSLNLLLSYLKPRYDLIYLKAAVKSQPAN